MSVDIEPGLRKVPNAYFDTYPIVPAGRTEVPTKQGRGELRLKGVPDLYARLDHNNTIGHAEGEFLGHPDGCHHGGTSLITGYVFYTPGGERVSVNDQAASYFEIGVLTYATNRRRPTSDELRRNRERSIGTTTFRELGSGTRRLFQGATLSAFAAAIELGEGVPLALQNNVSKRSVKGVPEARTMGDPHKTVGNLDVENQGAPEYPSEHLAMEQRLLDPDLMAGMALFMHAYITLVLDEQGKDASKIDVSPREFAPVGFAVHMNIPTGRLTDPHMVDYVSAVSDAVHDGYHLLAPHVFGGLSSTIKVGENTYSADREPGYREILHLDPDRRPTLGIGPRRFSHGGPLEVMNAPLYRDEDFPAYRTKERAKYHDMVREYAVVTARDLRKWERKNHLTGQ